MVRGRGRPTLGRVSTLTRTVLLAALVAALAACGVEPDTAVEQLEAELTAELEAREAVENELLERLERVEERLDVLADDPRVTSRLDGIEDELARMEAVLDVLDERIDAEGAARQLATEESEAAVSDLRGQLAELRSAVDRVGGGLEALRTELEVLRGRVDDLQ